LSAQAGGGGGGSLGEGVALWQQRAGQPGVVLQYKRCQATPTTFGKIYSKTSKFYKTTYTLIKSL
jgi:hypothetical protein